MTPRFGITEKPSQECEIWCEVKPGDIRVIAKEDNRESALKSINAIEHHVRNGKFPLDLLDECRVPTEELSIKDVETFFWKNRKVNLAA
jgi:hypothetical protein